MPPKVLVLVESDPRTSPRPAEAVRMTAGVNTWRRVEILLYLRGPAIRLVADVTGQLMEEEGLRRYLSLLAELGQAILVQADAPELKELENPLVALCPVNDEELARLASTCAVTLRF